MTRHVTPVEWVVQGPPPEPTWLDGMVSGMTWYRLMGRETLSGRDLNPPDGERRKMRISRIHSRTHL
jgi:hypothetical protein